MLGANNVSGTSIMGTTDTDNKTTSRWTRFAHFCSFQAEGKASLQGTPSRGNKKAQEDYAEYFRAFSSSGVFGAYDVKALSLAQSRYAGTLMAMKESSGIRLIDVSYTIPGSSQPASQAGPSPTNSLANYFTSKPSTARKRPAGSGGGKKHEKDGRVILAEFESHFILHVYAPNNGAKKESWGRRVAWDADVLRFFKKVKSEGGHPGLNGARKPVLYCGDLNVTPDPRLDCSHPKWMMQQFKRPER